MEDGNNLRVRLSKKIEDRLKKQAEIESKECKKLVSISDVIETALDWYFGSSLFEVNEKVNTKPIPPIQAKPAIDPTRNLWDALRNPEPNTLSIEEIKEALTNVGDGEDIILE